MLLVSLLGPVEVVRDGRRRSLGSSAQRALLAALALHPGEVVSADRLMDAIWGGELPASATSTLHAHLSRLRRLIGPEHLTTVRPGYALVDTETDVQVFADLIAADRREELAEAMTLWRGDPFGDLGDREAFRAELHRLVELRSSLEERLVELTIDEDPARAVAEAEALVEREPLRERRWELLAGGLHRLGRTAEALRALDRARSELAEVGLEPSKKLTELVERIAIEEPVPAGEPVPLRVSPPPAGLVGRARELEELERLVADHRVVTLIGSGGVGKTDLARTVGAATPGESRWCPLAAVEDRAGVAPAIARAVGAPIVGDIEATLIEWLKSRRLLLVLDNCEHVASAVADLVSRILDAAPDVDVLSTSREPLGVAAEWVFRVAPLDLDTAVELFESRARAAGAPSAALTREGVEHVCRLVDGLPLAIEMAAARVATLGVEELGRLLEQGIGILSGPDRRRRSLEDVVTWSVDMLGDEERRALRRATVFAGPFDLAAAQEIVGGPRIGKDRAAVLLASLTDRSLLEVNHGDGVLYSMLYTIRRVVSGTGEPTETEEAGQRHLGYFAELAEEVRRNSLGPEEVEWAAVALKWLPELRAGVYRSPASDEAIRICRALYPLAYHRARSDVAAWAEVVFPAVENSGRPGVGAVGALAALSAIQRGEVRLGEKLVERARMAAANDLDLLHVLEVEGDLRTYTGRLAEVDAIGEQMSEIARREGDSAAELFALLNVGLGRAYAGDTAGARHMVSRVREIEGRTNSATVTAWVDYLEGEVSLDEDPEAATQLLDRAVSMAARAGARMVEGVASLSSASVRARHGDVSEARRHFARTIQHWRTAGLWGHQWVTLRNLALLLERLGDDDSAAVLLGAVDERERPSYGKEAERLAQTRQMVAARLGEEKYRARRQEGAELSDGQVVEFALERIAD